MVKIGRKCGEKCEKMVETVKIGPEMVKLALAKMTTWQFLYFSTSTWWSNSSKTVHISYIRLFTVLLTIIPASQKEKKLDKNVAVHPWHLPEIWTKK